MSKVSVIIPVYNEEKTIAEIIRRVDDVELDLEKEIIVVDDVSSDGTMEILNERIKWLSDRLETYRSIWYNMFCE